MAGKRAAAKAHTRAKVIACARDLFATRGYVGVTVRDISKAVGMSTGAVFAHFSGKDDLFEVVIGRPAPPARLRSFLQSVAERLPGLVATDEFALIDQAKLLELDLYGEAPRR